ncbi:cation:proton antiporter [Rhizobiaceae bacterium n13]|uniref:Cation:proton antiporter n=1 Tax=Ferirhizobium litorale TaxID=2927786 RepID=A0AAE3QDV7_9HYPH|nr:cation:proton antiporter [Fererhizobium litorale]MDI7861292.1 cation:proton antiporter [Fererhizobium litorale]MDI7921439.1 cation:proton antiporter [Fererhizobium litorale]
MAPETILSSAIAFALVVLSISLFLTVWRALKGPTLPDRVVALDMLVAVAIGFIAIVAMKTGFTLYIDIAISLGLVGFLATVAFARFVLARGRTEEGDAAGERQIAAPAGGKVQKARSGVGPGHKRKGRK